MANTEKKIQWIEGGKQLGKVFSFEINEKKIWSSVGIQKWREKYQVYVDEIEEEDLAAEKYLREEIKKFDNLSDALQFIEQHTRTNLTEMQICKGQKIFNPNFELG
ncbi:hypothetical protein [Paenibacillus fonticola]|uniref:hypothetical protein n=1 Tax=Paenibacillus fonticola TaxID=379896 RepID=UPI00039D0F75|nr:hypothetical protein [Paenibacillus fonticola]